MNEWMNEWFLCLNSWIDKFRTLFYTTCKIYWHFSGCAAPLGSVPNLFNYVTSDSMTILYLYCILFDSSLHTIQGAERPARQNRDEWWINGGGIRRAIGAQMPGMMIGAEGEPMLYTRFVGMIQRKANLVCHSAMAGIVAEQYCPVLRSNPWKACLSMHWFGLSCSQVAVLQEWFFSCATQQQVNLPARLETIPGNPKNCEIIYCIRAVGYTCGHERLKNTHCRSEHGQQRVGSCLPRWYVQRWFNVGPTSQTLTQH